MTTILSVQIPIPQIDVLNQELASLKQTLAQQAADLAAVKTEISLAETTATNTLTSLNLEVSNLAGQVASLGTSLTTVSVALKSLLSSSTSAPTSGNTTSSSGTSTAPSPASSGTTTPSSGTTTTSNPPTGNTTTAPSSGSTTPSSGTTTTPPSSGTNISANLKDYGAKPVNFSALPKPAKGQTVIDPDFGTKITRITDCVADFKNLCAAPAYPTAMAWNCDDSYFILYVPGSTAQTGGQQGWALYSGKTYQFVTFLDINPADVEQFYWDHQDPKVLRYIDNHQMGSQNLSDLTSINVETGAKTIIHSFLPNGLPTGCPANTQGVRCGYPFALGVNANGDRIWGLGAFGPSVPNVAGELGVWVFGFNETTKAFILYDSTIPQPQARGSTPFPSVSGKYFVWNSAAASGLNSTPTTNAGVFDGTTGKFLRWIQFDTNEHCDTAKNSQGQDLVVGSQFSRNTGGNGNVIVANLETGVVSNFVGESSNPVFGYPATGSLSGSTAWKNPSWVATGMIGNIYGTGSNGVATPGSNGNSGPTANPCTVLDQELMLTNLNTGESFRFAHHRSTGNWSNAPQSNYWAQPNVTLSSDGTKLLVQSDWGNENPASPTVNPSAAVDTYLIEL